VLKPVYLILIITLILIFCYVLITNVLGIIENIALVSIFIVFLSLIATYKYKISWKVLSEHYNVYKPYDLNENVINRKLTTVRNFNFKPLFPFIPFIIVTILILIKPHYLFPTTGDLDYHLLRAREIIDNPIHGLFYDYLINYPIGRSIGHPPLLHAILATLWYIGGVRFADAILSISQILLSVGIATWFASKKYGPVAGFFASFLVLAAPRPDNLGVIMPATYIPIIAVLVIYFMPQNSKATVTAAVIGLWTHMISIVIFPLLFLFNKKGRQYLKNWKMGLPIIFSVVFWLGYWIYFTGQPGPLSAFNPSTTTYCWTNLPGIFVLLIFGLPGMVILYKEKRTEFNLFFVYLITVMFLQLLIGDISRGFQYAAVPLAILSGLSIQRIYTYISHNYQKKFTALFMIMLFVPVILGSSNFLISSINIPYGWNQINIPFENKYSKLGKYVISSTEKDDVIWADSSISYKVAWMTGRPMSNKGMEYPDKPLNSSQNMNIYLHSDYFLIKDKNNMSEKQISFY
jgi:hypothetical protein